MGTRSLIGREYEDGTVVAIYCHWDGYPEGVGKILMEAYTTPERVEALLTLGDLSVLGPCIGDQHDFGSHDTYSDWCLAYGRDRGDADTDARAYADVEAFHASADSSWAEYLYLYRDEGALGGAQGGWYVCGGDGLVAESAFRPLAGALAGAA